MRKALHDYHRKRNFNITSEPREQKAPADADVAPDAGRIFVVQKHHARNLHYDFRLELEGTLKSWAVPKGPSLDPAVKRLAVLVEDHPLSYAEFEGTIPKGQYGAGDVIVWDIGVWEPDGNPVQALRKGKLKFTLRGAKLSGTWNLVRTRSRDADNQWLLIKENDRSARNSSDYDVLAALPDSVLQQPAAKPKPPANRPRHPKSAAFPASLQPQLATLVDRPPPGDWLYEIKFDGYRMLTRIHRGRVTLFSRNGQDWSERLPHLVQALQNLELDDSWLDGEIVLMKNNLPDFQALQNAFKHHRVDEVVYYLFDAPFLHGLDLRDLGVEQRREQLQQALLNGADEGLRLSEIFTNERYHNLYDSACSMSLEGLIGKRAGSPYQSQRSTDWIKLKCLQRQEFVIVGYTPPQGQRKGFGALLLAVHSADGKQLEYCGKVGSGFNQRQLQDIHTRLRKLHRKTSPLRDTHGIDSATQWVKPVQVCEVEFSQWTREARIRHAVFVSLRDDKPATHIVRERAMAAAEIPAETAVQPAHRRLSKIGQVKISSPGRVIDPASGTRKIELAAFYASIAEWLLPHLHARPVALVRAPEGIAGEQFFQKHADRMTIPHIKHLDPALDPGHDRLMEVNSPDALVGCAQMGTVEFHTWGATTQNIDKPDRIILDLDPDPELPWQNMIEATQLVMSVLDELGLQYFLKTSGGKGMHIVIPIARHLDWDTAKLFARSISQFMAGQLPQRFTAKMGPRNRVGKIFVDYLRNGRGASTVAAWSVRARPNLPVSVPIHVDELEKLSSSAQWTLANLHSRLDAMTSDPWAGYAHNQRIKKRMWEKLGV